mgnify:CR=1 FL=1
MEHFLLQVMSTLVTEGQHFMSEMKNVFAKVVFTTPDQQESLHEDMINLRNNWGQLNSQLLQLKVYMITAHLMHFLASKLVKC